MIPDFWDQEGLQLTENFPIKVHEFDAPEVVKIPETTRRACDGSLWILERVLTPSANESILHVHPTVRPKKEHLLPPATYSFLLR